MTYHTHYCSGCDRHLPCSEDCTLEPGAYRGTSALCASCGPKDGCDELDRALHRIKESVTALRGERDLLKLRVEWKEAEVKALQATLEYAALNPEIPYSPVSREVLEEADEAVGAADKKRDEAKAAYLAAGGEE